MRLPHPLVGFWLLFFLFFNAVPAHSATYYGITIPEKILTQKAREQLAANPVLAHINDNSIPPMGNPRPSHNYTFDFLACLVLLLFFGLLRQRHPAYVRNIFRAFGNVTLSNRQLKEQIQQNSLPGILLDLLFCFSAAFFLYQTMVYMHWDSQIKHFSPALTITVIAVSIGIIYGIRFLLLRMSGWVFQMPEAMNHYSFNIFLFNRILGIILLPFSIIIAFGAGLWVQIVFLFAIIITIGMYLFRFIRSRQVFSQFLKFSKFHFILYLCASEILPIAIIIKLISNRLI